MRLSLPSAPPRYDARNEDVTRRAIERAILDTGASAPVGLVTWDDIGDKPTAFPPSPHALVGPQHTATGLTVGQVLKATGTTTFAFAALSGGDVTTGIVGLAYGGTGSNLNGTGPGFVRQTGVGANLSVSALVAADLPTHDIITKHSAAGLTVGHVLQATSATAFAFQALSAGSITTGTLPLARGGTGADLSATGPGFLRQATTGAAVTVSALTAADLPTHDIITKHSASGLTAGQVLKATAATVFAFATLDWTELGGKPATFPPAAHDIITTHTASGLTTGNVLRATSATTFAFQALSAADITTGTLGLARGGTGADLSATGPGFLKQASAGAPVTVAALTAADIPTHDIITKHSASGLTTGNALKALSATTFGFAAVDWTELTSKPATFPPSAHDIITAHTASGLTAGNVLKALTATTFGFAALTAGDLTGGNITWAQLPTGTGTWTANPTVSGTLTVTGLLTAQASVTITGGWTATNGALSATDAYLSMGATSHTLATNDHGVYNNVGNLNLAARGSFQFNVDTSGLNSVRSVSFIHMTSGVNFFSASSDGTAALRFDANNRLQLSVSSVGLVTLDAIGTSPSFSIADSVMVTATTFGVRNVLYTWPSTSVAGVLTNNGSGTLTWQAASTPGAHAASHQDGGSDEINVTNLSGLLADPQTPVAHGLVSAYHTASGLTTGHFLKALSATTFGFAAHGLTYTDVGAAPASHTHSAADITSGTLALARGGTGADLSATGPGFLKQASGGAVVTVAALAVADIPAHDIITKHTAAGLTTGQFLKATSATTFAFAAHGLTYTDVGAAPATHTHAAADITSGQLALARGGTGADLSATGPGFLKQASLGATVTVAALAAGDIPTHTHAASDITSGIFPVARGGTGLGTIAAFALWYASATDTVTTLAPNTTATKKFLRMTGTGTVGAAPAWDTLVAGDLPTHTHSGADITSGLVGLTYGGTGANLSATGPGFLKQASSGAVVTVAALAAGDIPTHTHAAADITSGQLALARGGTGADLSATGAGFLKQAGVGSVVTVAALAVADIPAHDIVTKHTASGLTTGHVFQALSATTFGFAALPAGSVPAHTHSAADITSGILALARGGTGSDLSATGAGFLKQAGVGSVVTVAALAVGDIPAHDIITKHTASGLTTGQFLKATGATTFAFAAHGLTYTDVGAAPTVHTHSAADITSGILALARGGTGADLSATGPGFLKQALAGATVTVAALAAGDLPAHTHSAADIVSGNLDWAELPTGSGTWTGTPTITGNITASAGVTHGAGQAMASASDPTNNRIVLDSTGDASWYSRSSIQLRIDADNNQTDRSFRVTKDAGTVIYEQVEGGMVGLGTTASTNTALKVSTTALTTASARAYGLIIQALAYTASANNDVINAINIAGNSTYAEGSAGLTGIQYIGLNYNSPTVSSGTIASEYAIYIAPLTAGTTKYAINVTGAGMTKLADVTAIGNGTPQANATLYIVAPATAMTGTLQNGIDVNLVGTSTATANVIGIRVAAQSAAAAITVGDVRGIFIQSPTAGAGSTITTVYGLRVGDQLAGVTNYAIYTAKGLVMFTDRTAVGGNTPQTDTTLYVSAGVTGYTGTLQRGIFVDFLGNASGTSAHAAIMARVQTAAAAYTTNVAYGLYVYDAVLGAGSTMTTQTGLYIEAQTKGATNYAIYTNAGTVRLGGAVQLISSSLTINGVAYTWPASVAAGVLQSTAGGVLSWVAAPAPAAHHTTHESGGSDVISVAGLTGLLATAQTPVAHDIITLHTASGLTTGNVLRATGATTFAFQALVAGDLPTHTHSAADITSGTLAIARGGTGLATIAAFALYYASATDTLATLAPNTTATKKLLRMTGTGAAGTAPVWDTLVAGDIAAGTFPSGTFTFPGDVGLHNVAYTWPSAQGAANTVLKNNGSGTLTWAAPPESANIGAATVALRTTNVSAVGSVTFDSTYYNGGNFYAVGGGANWSLPKIGRYLVTVTGYQVFGSAGGNYNAEFQIFHSEYSSGSTYRAIYRHTGYQGSKWAPIAMAVVIDATTTTSTLYLYCNAAGATATELQMAVIYLGTGT